MTTATIDPPAPTGRTPWHLWLVGLIGVPWNGFGVYDYLMTNTQGEPYLRAMGMTDAQVAYLDAFPAWMTAVWAIGVWGALLGTLLLLLRRRWAVYVFGVSLGALIISLIYQFLLSNGAEVMGSASAMSAVVLAGAVFFLLYSAWMLRRGVLR